MLKDQFEALVRVEIQPQRQLFILNVGYHAARPDHLGLFLLEGHGEIGVHESALEGDREREHFGFG